MLDVPLLGLGVGPEVRRTHLVLQERHCPAAVDARQGLLDGRDRPFPVAHPFAFSGQKSDAAHASLCAARYLVRSSVRKARTSQCWYLHG